MANFFASASRPVSIVDPRLGSYRATTSIYGNVLPGLYGVQAVPGNVIWSGDFQSVPAAQNYAGKGGPNPAVGNEWNYTTAIIIALCKGTVVQLGSVWLDSAQLELVTATSTVTVPGAGGTVPITPPGGGAAQFEHGAGKQTAYSVVADDYGSPGPVTLTGTQPVPMTKVTGTPAAGQYAFAVSGLNAEYTFAAADAGAEVVVTYTYSIPNSNNEGLPINTLSLSLFEGELGQAVWDYLTTNFPDQALGYSQIAYVANPSLALGTSGAVPNFLFEVYGPLSFGGGIIDCDPSAIAYDLLTNALNGGLIPEARVGSMTQWSNYCVANGLFFSLLLDSQRSVSDWIQDLLDASNSNAFWSEGVFKFQSYGDTTAVGNGVTYSPQTAPVYDLDDDDFLVDSAGQDGVTEVRRAVQDAYNIIQVEWSNRSNEYNLETVEESNDWSIGRIGPRVQSPAAYHFITTLPVAQLVANTLLKRSVYLLPQYKFRLGWQYSLLEVMDMVTLTVPELDLDKLPVRIIEIEEDTNGELQITAESFPWGTAQPTQNPKQSATPGKSNSGLDPGSCNSPVIFELTNRSTRWQGYTIGFAVSGGENWGGCQIWMSQDGTTYRQIGTLTGNSRMGVLTANYPSGSDPDTADTLAVNLSESFGVLTSAADSDADVFATVSLVGDELVSYSSAVLTSAYNYNLGTYVRRGILGSEIAAHSTGDPFVRLDSGIFTYVYDPVLIGQPLYFKFCGFNKLGLSVQGLAAATAYTFTPSGDNIGIVDVSAGQIAASTNLPPNSPLNTTNTATVDSIDAGSNATIRVYGPGGPGTGFTRYSGSATTSIPSATLTGYAYDTTYYVVYDGTSYSVLTTFTAALADQYLWTGAVTTVSHGGGGGSSGGGGDSGGGSGGRPIL